MSYDNDHYYHEVDHVAKPTNMPCRMVFSSVEYAVDYPPESIEIAGTRWIREDVAHGLESGQRIH